MQVWTKAPARPGALCLTLGLLLGLFLGACGETAPEGPTMPIQEVQISLVMDESVREVLTENKELPVVPLTVAPASKSDHDGGPLPALVLCPPAEVRFPLGQMAPSSELILAAGLDESSYEGEDSGRVRFSMMANGKLVFEHSAPFGKQVPEDQRTWNRVRIPLAGIADFTIKTELIEGQGKPLACFGSMEVVTVSQRPRELASAQAPNVVMIVVDTLRYDRLGCYGNTGGFSPNIDALAARGVVYESAYSAAPWTWPSTASIFTGLTPAEHGITSYEACYLAQELATFGEVMQRAGWTTGGFSCNPLICTEKAFAQGFESFQSYEWKHADVLMTDALGWLAHSGDWRFLLYLQFVDPHDYRPTQANKKKFVGKLPEGFSHRAARDLFAKRVLNEPYDAEQLESYNRYLSELYDASIADVDDELGRLIEDLKARGQFENTIFIITADHGEEFLDHGMLYHGNQLHRELVGIPLIMAGPGIPKGKRVNERVENRFLAGTLLKHLGLETPGGLAGVDLLSNAETLAGSEEAAFISTTLGMWPRAGGPHWKGLTMHGVMLGDELLMWVPEGPEGQSAVALFDMSVDPDARKDLSVERPERCAALQALIERWLARGAKVRPNVMSGGDSALKKLQAMGYLGK